jgi:hypothetical protein
VNLRPLAIATAACGAMALMANAALAGSGLTVGDTLDLQFWYPSVGAASPDEGDITYTGPGQTTAQIDDDGYLVLNDNSITFVVDDNSSTFQIQPFVGLAVIDVSNPDAFNGWTLLSDTVGAVSTDLGGGDAAVNWSGRPLNGGESVVGAGGGGGGGVPEPAAWTLMIVGFGALGAALRTRRRPVAATV